MITGMVLHFPMQYRRAVRYVGQSRDVVRSIVVNRT